MSKNKPGTGRQLVERLRGVRVGLREDLEVSRHRFRGEPCYVVRDPLTFQSHRLDPPDYQIVVALDETRALGAIFQDLVEEGSLRAEDDERFYMFVFQLHKLGFLTLPISDEKILYKRHKARQEARRSKRFMSILFCQIPVWNPDTFLNRTARYAAPLFTRWAFIAWLLCMLGAFVAVSTRWTDFLEPLTGLLATRNLILIWLLLVVLKVAHEFGHAFACKHFGGHVPEMGVMLILGTPCAYVDATASWGFTQRSHRLIVALAGMYIETWIAAGAAFVWALSDPGLLNSAAYNVIFLAGVTTILFNINPLMRYDGYYIASDLLEVPNLRPRAQQAVGRFLKQHLLKLPQQTPQWSSGMERLLLTFGGAATAYRALVLVGIATLLAAKLGMIGLFAAGAFLTFTTLSWLRRKVGYLWFSEETAPVRWRAIGVSMVLLLGVPAGLAMLPVEVWSHAPGVLRYADETTVRAASPGFLDSIAVATGSDVDAGAPLVAMRNDSLIESAIRAREAYELCEARYEILYASAPSEAASQQVRLRALREQVASTERRLRELQVTADQTGVLLQLPQPGEVGRFYQQGEPLAVIGAGDWQVQVHLTADQIANAGVTIGTAVEFRPACKAELRIPGRIVDLQPMASRKIDQMAVTQFGGGEIIVGEDGQTAQPYMTVTVALEAQDDVALQHGLTGRVGFQAPHQPIGLAIYRQVVRFINRLEV